MAGKSVIMGALNLYLDFINMFLFLLQVHGRPPLKASLQEGQKRGPAERSAGPLFFGAFRSCHGFKRTMAGPVLCKAPGGKVGAKTGLTESVLSRVKETWLAQSQ